MWLPMYPAPPVTKTVMPNLSLHCLPEPKQG
jgi:hypothetical protein